MDDQALILPPWDLCGFDRDFDPYSVPVDAFRVRWHYRGFEIDAVEVEEVSARDPNEHDGRWMELAFMPYEPEVACLDSGEWVVPWYLPVADALYVERGRRREADLAARFEGHRERWEAFWREMVTAALRPRWPLSPPPRSPHGDPVLR